jgi:hypothetical protein
MVNLVSSSIEPQTQVVDPVPSSISPTLHQKSVTQVFDPVPSSFSPTLHPKSAKVVAPFTSLVNPTLPLRSAKVTDPVPSSVSPTLHLKSAKVVSLVTSLVNPTLPLRSAKVTDLVPSSVSPTLHSKSSKVVSLVTSLVNPTLPLRSSKVTDLVPSSASPTLHPKSAKVVSLVTSSANPSLSLKSTKVVDPSPPLVDPTLPLESKLDTSHVFLVDIESTMLEGIPHSPAKPPPSNEAILFDWGVLTGSRLPSHIPFQITVQVFGRDVPQTLIDEGASVSILSSIAWNALGCPHIVSVTQNLLYFSRRTNQPLGTLPQFPITLGGKNVFIDVMVVRGPLDFALLLG